MAIRRSHYEITKALRHGVRQGLLRLRGAGMLWMLVILGCAALAQAQPPAPIEWGESHLLLDAGLEYGVRNVYARGDTILLLATFGENPQRFAAACVTGDNGQTWSPWHVFSIEYSMTAAATGAITNHALLCCAQVQSNSWGIYRTTDLGLTWQTPLIHSGNTYIIAVRNDTAFCNMANAIRWTPDFGVSFSPGRPIDMGSTPLRITSGTDPETLHLFAASRFESWEPQHLYYARGGLLEGEFEPLRNLNPDNAWTSSVSVQFADDGTGMALTAIRYNLPAPNWSAMHLRITHDNGLTWSAPDTITPAESALFTEEWVRTSQGRWVLVWLDSTRQQGFNAAGAWYRFSADNGRNWYPAQQFSGDSTWSSGGAHEVDFNGEIIRVYSCFGIQSGVYGNYYVQIEGRLQPDSLIPEIQPLLLPDDSLFDIDTVWFQAICWDNDTIAAVFVRLLGESGLVDSVQLDYIGNHIYRGGWPVAEPGTYCYRIHVTDFWTNNRMFPDADSLCFVAIDLASASGSPSLSSLPLIRPFPNPFNARTEIRFVLPQTGQATLTIYDLAGREVAMLADETFAAGEHSVAWNAAGLPSGVYFTRLHAGEFAVTRKLLLLR